MIFQPRHHSLLHVHWHLAELLVDIPTLSVSDATPDSSKFKTQAREFCESSHNLNRCGLHYTPLLRHKSCLQTRFLARRISMKRCAIKGLLIDGTNIDSYCHSCPSSVWHLHAGVSNAGSLRTYHRHGRRSLYTVSGFTLFFFHRLLT
jgi:hypothetical protein